MMSNVELRRLRMVSPGSGASVVGLCLAVNLSGAVVLAEEIVLPHQFRAGEVAKAEEVSENFASLKRAVESARRDTPGGLKPRFAYYGGVPFEGECDRDEDCGEGEICANNDGLIGACVKRCSCVNGDPREFERDLRCEDETCISGVCDILSIDIDDDTDDGVYVYSNERAACNEEISCDPEGPACTLGICSPAGYIIRIDRSRGPDNGGRNEHVCGTGFTMLDHEGSGYLVRILHSDPRGYGRSHSLFLSIDDDTPQFIAPQAFDARCNYPNVDGRAFTADGARVVHAECQHVIDFSPGLRFDSRLRLDVSDNDLGVNRNLGSGRVAVMYFVE